MKWDVKHDRAKRIIDRFLDNAGYWQESEDLADGLTEEERILVDEELHIMIASIRKRYKLDVRLENTPEDAVEPQAAVKNEKAEDKSKEEEKPKRGRKKKTAVKTTEEKPKRGRKKKEDVEATSEQAKTA